MNTLALIPARGGSKRIPRKNIRPLAGKPLIAWTIEMAAACSNLDRVIVSTDDQEIADIAKRYGAEVPFLRPPELARDGTPNVDATIHAIQWLEEREGYRPDSVMVLQPTSPLRTEEDMGAAINLAIRTSADAVISVCEVKHHPYWTKHLTDDGRLLDPSWLDQSYGCRQDLPPFYGLNGAIYLAKRSVLLADRSFYTRKVYAYIMPPERSLDIDSLWDLHLAELIVSQRMYDETRGSRTA